jgi:hypothetical protein
MPIHGNTLLKEETTLSGEVDEDEEYEEDYEYNDDDDAPEEDTVIISPLSEPEIIKSFKDMYINRSNYDGVMGYYAENTVTKRAATCHKYGMICAGPINLYSYMEVSPNIGYFTLWHDEKVDYKDAEAFWNFIFSPKWSPWRSICDHITLVRDSDGKLQAWKIDTFDVPQDILFNLMIAARIPLEHTATLKLYMSLINGGISRYAAMYWCAFLAEKNGKPYMIAGQGHFPFDNSSVECVNLAYMKNGKPDTHGKYHSRLHNRLEYNKMWYDKGFSPYSHNKSTRLMDKYGTLLTPKQNKNKVSTAKFGKATNAIDPYKKDKIDVTVEEFITNLKDNPTLWRVKEDAN